ncbi:MAG: pantetheine-phosphate adenylyltransferase [Deltaproteobacteria bacterium RIFCSPHIGHO2_02_FULL_40_11]|nr:MAG: pantetheine-phosphate adenylyltransferase [Deltaproteobacteria bacterium RIFCSPHIGHO2_02_FULL_40_11]
MRNVSKLAIYPGSFDPVTNGHIDIVQRSLKIFDTVIVLVASHAQKQGLFTLKEKMEMLQEAFGKELRVKIDSTTGLLVEYAKSKKAHAIIRGLRAISDFEFEFQMESMNKRLYPNLETIFMMTGSNHHFISSSLVREVASLGGNLKDIVPHFIEARLRKKFSI